MGRVEAEMALRTLKGTSLPFQMQLSKWTVRAAMASTLFFSSHFTHTHAHTHPTENSVLE